jgi:2-iminobutanoate/2-iminopropanoate deaminase
MRTIFTEEAPSPAGHYSQAVESGGMVFVSGTLPSTKPAEGSPPSFEEQARAVLQHCERILASAGCRLDDVVQCTAYVVGIDNWPCFNRVYSERFGAHRPARAVVPVPELHHGYLIEVQMTAALPGRG